MADRRRKERVAILGSGNWGSVAAKLVGTNTARYPDVFEAEARMWVYEEMVEGRKLTEIINTEHENVKYLKGVKLPRNIIADPDPVSTIRGATVLVFVLPHQFLPRLLRDIKDHVERDVKSITLIKGFDTNKDGIVILSEEISKSLGGRFKCDSLMGANIADEVGLEKFCETTIGYNSVESGELFRKLFETDYFQINIVPDAVGVELCGALKNVVALGAGFCDGLGTGNNTKAAIIRIGLGEMQRFTQTFFPGAGKDVTYFESCGLADLVTTCYGGRNRKTAEAFVKTGKSFEVLEKEMLGGQKLQGTITAIECMKAIRKRGMEARFPLFTVIYRICFEGLPAREMFAGLQKSRL